MKFVLLQILMTLLTTKIILMEQIKVLFSHHLKAQVKKELNLLMKKSKIKQSLNMEEDN